MREFPEARIALCRCGIAKKVYGVRFEKNNDGWSYNWAFPIKLQEAEREKYGEYLLEGVISKSPEYPGCPTCGANYFVVCGACGKLNCNNATSSHFKCEWCGFEGELSSYSDEERPRSKGKGNGIRIRTGNDR